MASMSKKEYVAKVDGLQPGQLLCFRFPPVFGGNQVVIRANVETPGKKQKRFSVFWMSEAGVISESDPVFHTGKAKNAAVWAFERDGVLVEPPVPVQKAV